MQANILQILRYCSLNMSQSSTKKTFLDTYSQLLYHHSTACTILVHVHQGSRLDKLQLHLEPACCVMSNIFQSINQNLGVISASLVKKFDIQFVCIKRLRPAILVIDFDENRLQSVIMTLV